MEHWILYYDSHYDAVPWPFVRSWEEWIRQPEPLVHSCDDFGRASPSDGLGETPTVPARLPRSVPRGRYRMAIYHDPEFLYVFLEAEDGPVVLSKEQLDRIPHLTGLSRLYHVLAVLSADQQFVYQFCLDAGREKDGSIKPVLHGARRVEPPAREMQWDFASVPRDGGELVSWKISRSSIPDAFTGNTLRVSLSRICHHTLEAVAWGAHCSWAPRPDEFAIVRLVANETRPPWPRLRRVELLYDPVAEQGRFRMTWEGRYVPQEEVAHLNVRNTHIVPWRKCSLRVNQFDYLLAMNDVAESDLLPIPDGFNAVHIASAGGPATEFILEKWTGNRIIASPLPPKPPRAREWIRERIRNECETAIAESRKRHSGPGKPEYVVWDVYGAASMGRVYHHIHPDARLLDVVRAEADFTLSLQREDGLFTGFHLGTRGRKWAPWAGGAYDSGPAGELWVVAAWLLKDQKYLEASRRLLRAYQDYRVEFNHNYAAFAIYHLVAHYRLTREPLALEHALYYGRNIVAVDILPLGYQGGHNYYSVYGGVTLRAMAMLCAVLPANEPYKAILRELCVRMANQLITRLQPDGLFDGRNRYFLGLHHWLWGLFSVAFVVPPDDVARIDAVVQRMLHIPDDSWERSMWERLASSDFVRYHACREDLLGGKELDSLARI